MAASVAWGPAPLASFSCLWWGPRHHGASCNFQNGGRPQPKVVWPFLQLSVWGRSPAETRVVLVATFKMVAKCFLQLSEWGPTAAKSRVVLVATCKMTTSRE
ncbi:hypothetical protein CAUPRSCDRAFT_12396 [Caulochytrium protostelioides]|uniref:Uncharacterized protein n=1 Tax=Caulochytrium protostelioides TaxID=1555241 RepID=A0A4P9WUF6_9FUNG|nr:hypothetical protein CAUPRSCDRAFT_12396 [Caulochytrium protostelioides]